MASFLSHGCHLDSIFTDDIYDVDCSSLTEMLMNDGDMSFAAMVDASSLLIVSLSEPHVPQRTYFLQLCLISDMGVYEVKAVHRASQIVNYCRHWVARIYCFYFCKKDVDGVHVRLTMEHKKRMENMTWKIQAKKSIDSRELFFLTFWSGQRARTIWSSFVGRSRNWDVRSNTLSPEGAMSQYRDRGNNNLNNANIVVGKSFTQRGCLTLAGVYGFWKPVSMLDRLNHDEYAT
ncbi:hypothetical protein Tco_0299613 [Tanacetum coccineum]